MTINQPPLITSLEHRWFVPAAYTTAADQKIVILMHGRGDSLASYRLLAREINLSGLSYLLLNGPFPSAPGKSWYHYPFGVASPDLETSQKQLTSIIKQLVNAGIAKSDIIVGGFSQGATMALNTLLVDAEANGPFGGIIALSPRCLWEKSFIDKVEKWESPLFISHGREDEILPFETTDLLAKSFEKRSSQLTWQPFAGGHEIDIDTILGLRNWLAPLI